MAARSRSTAIMYASGIRELSDELVERELGPRRKRVLRARERVIEHEQWTEIDRELKAARESTG